MSESLQSRLAYEAKCIENDVSSRSVYRVLLEASDAIGSYESRLDQLTEHRERAYNELAEISAENGTLRSRLDSIHRLLIGPYNCRVSDATELVENILEQCIELSKRQGSEVSGPQGKAPPVSDKLAASPAAVETALPKSDASHWPWTLDETMAGLHGGDMDSLAYPPLDRRRYRQSGIEKLAAHGITLPPE